MHNERIKTKSIFIQNSFLLNLQSDLQHLWIQKGQLNTSHRG